MFKANISPLVAEQYKRTKLFVVTTSSGERVIVDPSLTVLRVYMVINFHLMAEVACSRAPLVVFLPSYQHRSLDRTDRNDLR